MIFQFDKPAGAFGQPEFSILENGPVRAVVRVVTRFAQSVLDQRFTLYANADQLEVEAHLDMQEKQRMLKLCFPTVYSDEYAEIPYGALRRSACGNEEHCQRWIALENGKAGLALVNDGKYSYSIENGTMALTVAHTSVYADHYGQNHRDETVEYMDIGKQVFRYALCPYEGGWQNAGLNRRAALINRSLPRVVETYHEGPLSGEYSGLSISDPAVDASVIKRAEDGLGWVIRLSETTGQPRSAHISASFACRELDVSLTPFQLKTLYLPDDASKPVREILLTEL
jgi:alpha-mannosidase